MRSTEKYISFIALLAVVWAAGCKSFSTSLHIPVRKIPDTYNGSNDTLNMADIQWQQFFGDSLLVQLIDTALAHNFDLQMALQRIEVARSDVKLSKGNLLPQVSLGVSGGVRKFGLYTMDGAGNITTEITPGQITPTNLPDFFVGFNASWEIDIWGKLRNQKKAAVSRYLASIEGTRFVLTGLISEVALNYYELVALDNELEIIRQTIVAQEDALTVVQVQKETGRVNDLAVQQFEAQLLQSKVMEKETIQALIEVENRLNLLLGRYYEPIARNKTSLFADTPQEIHTGIPSDLLTNRPDIKEAEFFVLATKGDLKAAKAAFFPTLNISASIGFQAFNPAFLFTAPASIAYAMLGNLMMPLINFSALKAQFNTAKANQLEAMYNYQKAILTGYVEVYNEMNGIRMLEEVTELKTRETEILTHSVETSTDLLASGRASYLEVLVARQNALYSQLELVQIRKRQHQNVVNLYRSLGGGWR